MQSFTSKLLGKSASEGKKTSASSSRKNTIAGVAQNVEDIDEVDEQGQSILMGIIAQLRPGCDLSRITLPTFILERKSMLERITNQLQQPDLVLKAEATRDDPIERFLLVVKWYMSCWHIAPKAVKKPLNPILGEYFTCYWDLSNGEQAYYISEQTSHHPPKSSYFYTIPSANIRVDGIVIPKSRFLGNSTAAIMDGTTKLSFLNIHDKETGEPEIYTLTQPNMYARGILFGTLKFELGDHLIVKCQHTNLVADIEFKTKGFISGTYNAIHGLISNSKTGEDLYELTGKWNEEMFIKDLSTGEKKVFWDCDEANPLKPKVRDLDEQGEYESRKLWKKVTDALAKRDHKIATDEKFKIEEEQRTEATMREEDGVEFHPKLFRPLSIQESVEEGNDKLEFVIYKDRILERDLEDHNGDAVEKHLFEMAPVLPGQKFDKQFEIPAYQKISTNQD
ncbi:DEKNAAC101972 [Brettanomyces naardenensis]|uniref:DEKNAAC101972 n=1 Tax=Brettanomyces naardenensis TaxID=13370 RepID=A0A448YJG2_BRENA|nr:DEKNAAC101972 [Brettanomyces naardenensis]